MAQYQTIARPYAVAVFEDAKADQNALIAWSNVLQVLSIVVAQKAVQQLIFDPTQTPSMIKNTLGQLTEAAVANDVIALGVKFENFLQLLIEHKRLIALPDMFHLYHQLLAEQNNVLDVTVSSPFELDDDQQRELALALKKRFNKEVSLTFDLDKSLIGGAVVRTDKFVIDGSVKGKLTRLYHSLISAKG